MGRNGAGKSTTMKAVMGLVPPAGGSVTFEGKAVQGREPFEIARLGRRIYHDALIERTDPRGVPYYWIGGSLPTYERNAGSDAEAALDGWVSVTPLRLDLACPELMARTESFESTFNGGE